MQLIQHVSNSRKPGIWNQIVAIGLCGFIQSSFIECGKHGKTLFSVGAK